MEMSFSWLKKKAQACVKRSRKSSTATRFCKRCFDALQYGNLHVLFDKEASLCEKCFREFEPRIKRFRVSGVSSLGLYPYNEAIRNTLYLFKGCYDYEMGAVFLDYQKWWLSLRYRGYTIIPAPSFRGHDEKRGFNHVAVMFSFLGLPIVSAVEKIEERKQSSLTAKDRAKIGEILRWKPNVYIEGKKILLVDDVYTTGSTMRAMIRLVKAHHPKAIKVLVMAYSEAHAHAT